MKKATRPGHLARYAKHAGITQEAAARQLQKAGIDYYQPFIFSKADKIIAGGRHASRAKFAKRTLSVQPETPVEDLPSNGITFLEAQRRKELANAQLKELEVRRRAGELIEVDEVKKSIFEKGRQVRDGILSVPDRLAGILAAETDQSKVHALLTKELHQALEGLTNG